MAIDSKIGRRILCVTMKRAQHGHRLASLVDDRRIIVVAVACAAGGLCVMLMFLGGPSLPECDVAISLSLAPLALFLSIFIVVFFLFVCVCVRVHVFGFSCL